MIALIIILVILLVLLALFIIAYVAHSKIFGGRFTKDPLVKYYSNLEFNINRKELEINDNGTILRGYLYNYDAYTKSPIVVFAHGMWCNVDAYNQDICSIAQAGFEVIAINHRGVDISDGKSLMGFSGSLRALDKTISYIKSADEFKNRDIYVVGHSWGAYGALNIIGYHPDIKKVIAMAPFVTPRRLLMGMLPKGLWGLIPFICLVDLIKCGKYALKNSKTSLSKYNGRALILHSKNDPMVSYSLNSGYLKEIGVNSRFIINEDRGHNPNYTKEAVAYMGEYLSALKKLTKEEAIEYKKQANFHLMGELDINIMNSIIEFLLY